MGDLIYYALIIAAGVIGYGIGRKTSEREDKK